MDFEIADGYLKKYTGNQAEVIVPEGVVRIGPKAFENCKDIENIVLQPGVKEIEVYAFSGCKGLKHITIPNGVEDIQPAAFSDCINLREIVLPATVMDISATVFSNCVSMEQIDVSEENKWFRAIDGILYNKAGDTLLYCPRAKKNASVYGHTTTIASIAFTGCGKLKEIYLPDCLTTIEEGAFSWCEELISIEIPEKVSQIAENVFFGCTQLENINVKKENSVYCSVEGVLYDKDISNLIMCPLGKKRVVVPNGVKNIEKNAFSHNTWFSPNHLIEVKLPDGLETIGENAFKNCIELETINLPDTVKTIGHNAFENCKSLTFVELPQSLTRVNMELFLGCEHLEKVKLPMKLKKIGKHAFKECSGLKEMVLPQGLTTIDNLAFEDCAGLEEIEIPESVTDVGKMAFWGCSGIRHIKVRSDKVKFTGKAFSECSALQRLDVPENLAGVLNQIVPDHFVAVGIPDIASVSTKYRPYAAVGFAEDERDCKNENGKKYLQYIKSNVAKLISVAIEHPALFHLMLREKLIAAKDLEAVTNAVQESGNTELMAAMLEYGNSSVSEKDKAKAKAKKEERETNVTSFVFDAEKLEALNGKTFVVTGKLKTFVSRDELKECLTTCGAVLTETLAEGVDYLITNTPNSGTAKNKKAVELGVKRITEDEFNEMIGRSVQK